jgi:hypothetical protein
MRPDSTGSGFAWQERRDNETARMMKNIRSVFIFPTPFYWLQPRCTMVFPVRWAPSLIYQKPGSSQGFGSFGTSASGGFPGTARHRFSLLSLGEMNLEKIVYTITRTVLELFLSVVAGKRRKKVVKNQLYGGINNRFLITKDRRIS